MSKDIYVVIEQRDGIVSHVSYELLGEANSLAQDLGQEVVAVLLGSGIEKEAQSLIYYGADRVLVIDDPILKEYTTEPYAKAVAHIIGDRAPEIILYGATSIGRDLAPRIAARVKTGLTADCTGLCIDPETKLLRMTRPAFGGNLMAVILCKKHRPQMATVRPGVMQLLEKDADRKGVIEKIDIAFTDDDMPVEILEVIKKDKRAADITQAKVLVSGGRGIGGAEKFRVIRELADALGGEVSGSRAAVDSGWIDKECQVGQTGKTVKPDLYMACGISGAIQHVAGMENSGVVIAINKNETAPIFDVADLGIVGDLHAILPRLTEEVNKAKSEGLAYTAPSSEQFIGLENILYHTQNGIAYLTINRPQALNALNSKTLKEIDAIADKLQNDESIKVLVIRGAGRAFVAGADITEMNEMTEEESRKHSAFAQATFVKIKNLPQIVIAAINGYALGGGNELALACDIRIASNRAKFGQPEVNLGVLPGFTGSQQLPRQVGKSYAKEMIFTADMISAEEAYRIGLVNKVVAPEALMRTVRDLGLKIMSKGIQAVRFAKRAINEGMEVDLEKALELENQAWVDCFKTQDKKEGMTAFVEKRKPVFKGL